MADISVEPRDGGTFEVRIRSGRTTTTHEVSVPEDLGRSLGCEQLDASDLVRLSFEFLLEREPATSILKRFSLDVIGDYFPEYGREMHIRCNDLEG